MINQIGKSTNYYYKKHINKCIFLGVFLHYSLFNNLVFIIPTFRMMNYISTFIRGYIFIKKTISKSVQFINRQKLN